jgi:ELP3 family radical SAM enzyme/protein acetyltransferase
MASCASTALSGTDLDIEGLVKPTFLKEDDIPILRKVVQSMMTECSVSKDTLTHKNIFAFFRKMSKEYKIDPMSCGSVLYVYRTMCKSGEISHKEWDDTFESILKTKHMREQSGVMVIAVFTSPFPETEVIVNKETGETELVKQDFTCKFDCFFCPDQPGQPRSYVRGEPGVERANNNEFHTVAQIWDRANQYMTMGMVVDKIELLVLGGTWHSYPADYRERFLIDVFYAANTYYDPHRVSDPREKKTLAEEHVINHTSLSRIIGLTIETRPDQITPATLVEMRRQGVTRVQLGLQHTEDRILDRVGRRCNTTIAKRALRLLKDNCFKIDGHFMHDLPQPLKEGVNWRKAAFEQDDIDTTVDMREWDKKMSMQICSDPEWQVDQIKLYPCVTMDHTRILDEFERGIYKPYGQQDNVKEPTILYEDLIWVKQHLPYWIRVNRLVRDIPSSTYHKGGHKDSGAHGTIKKMMKTRGLECKSIDALEVRDQHVDSSTAELFVDTYEAQDGTEHFLSFMTPNRKTLFGFLRLRFTKHAGYQIKSESKHVVVFPELVDCALIRELHIYGKVVQVNSEKKNANLPQHSGFGTRLVKKAIDMARVTGGFSKIAVISGVGTTMYYRKLGFEIDSMFMTRSTNA